ncbi:Muskelin N-terminus-domain-containing protein [Lyophyllum atratum]|nr:Muskelin N-terminus-domain-containing protein [Lyophyllum atratum]
MFSGSQLNVEASVPLTYTIDRSSAHSGRYAAENILVDRSMDQASRWSGNSQGNSNQWILLRLQNLAVLRTVTFGKFHKPHPCNMKEFKLYVGTNSEHMSEVLHAGLKNDSIPETFPIKHLNNAGVSFPTQYIKIVPMSAHGQSFHTSIWHVSMTGITNAAVVEQVRKKYDEYRETAALRHVLKHLRQRRLLTPYESIVSRSGFQLEHPLITKLHESVVLQGNWQRAEQLVSIISKAGLCDSYLHGTQPYAVWKQLRGTDPDGDVPSPRGGHAMCIDPVNDMIYLFGGWDGEKSLDDFWVYSVKEDKWRVLSHSTSGEQNAPGARSCHKMVFDTKTGSIYLLGRLSDLDSARATNEGGTPGSSEGTARDSSTPPVRAFCSEFYRYHTRGMDSGKWDFLYFDTASSGGPPLVFDHQMVMDCETQILYVFGGRVVDGDWDSVKYSGLYSYNVRLSKWKLLQHPDSSNSSQTIIPSRFGHSMVIEPSTRTLFIFAGQRDDKYLSDMYAYDIATNTATELYSNFSASGGPDSCFSQRAVIDPNSRELYVFCGLTRSQQGGEITTLASESPNWLFRYSRRPGTWTQILSPPSYGSPKGVAHHLAEGESAEEPVARYAHQVVYNPNTKTVFMHGGNAGIVGQMEHGRSRADVPVEEGQKEERLDDLWQMTLIRVGSEEVVRRATYKIRQQQFQEMCEDAPPIKALSFLQTEVSAVVDHTDAEETNVFRSLLTHLLSPSIPSPSSQPPSSAPSPYSRLKSSPSSDGSPPRKRSRPDTPDTDIDGPWTDQLDEDESGATHGVRAVNPQALKEVEDPLEREVRDAEVGVGAGKLTAARFSQRNEVFESLLEFVTESEKQPTGSLLDVFGVDEGGL